MSHSLIHCDSLQLPWSDVFGLFCFVFRGDRVARQRADMSGIRMHDGKFTKTNKK